MWISRLDSGFQPLFLRRRPVFSQIDLEKVSFSGFLPEKDISLAEKQKRIIFFARIPKKGYFRQENRNLCEKRRPIDISAFSLFRCSTCMGNPSDKTNKTKRRFSIDIRDRRSLMKVESGVFSTVYFYAHGAGYTSCQKL